MHSKSWLSVTNWWKSFSCKAYTRPESKKWLPSRKRRESTRDFCSSSISMESNPRVFHDPWRGRWHSFPDKEAESRTTTHVCRSRRRKPTEGRMPWTPAPAQTTKTTDFYLAESTHRSYFLRTTGMPGHRKQRPKRRDDESFARDDRRFEKFSRLAVPKTRWR